MRVPIRARLTLTYSAVFSCLFALLAAGTWMATRAAVLTVADRELRARLDGLDDHLARHIGKYDWAALRDTLAAHPAFEPALLRIADQRGTALVEGAGMRAVRGTPASGSATLSTWQRDDQTLRILTARRRYAGADYDLTLGVDLLLAGAVLQRLWLVILVSAPAVLLAASWAGYWISGRALAPVTGLMAAARTIDSSRLDARLDVPSTGDEIEQLATTLNAMLARIEDGVRHVRRFTADASHELRTPVAIIRAAAEVALVHQGPDHRPLQRALERVLREAEHATHVIEDLLFLARSDAGTERRTDTAVDLTASIAAAASQIEPLAAARRVSLVTESGVSRVVDGDAQDLRRLWLILLDNALKYTPAGGRVVIRTGEQGGSACVEVADTGIGIAPEHLPQLFERFYRVDAARTRGRGGAGLGLAIAASIAARHDLHLAVETTPGLGTTFRVLFAAARVAPLAEAG